jgi:2-polyprenyl-6-methoxyphenol hydroxylase-like FAD-dependent oxidoreductase
MDIRQFYVIPPFICALFRSASELPEVRTFNTTVDETVCRGDGAAIACSDTIVEPSIVVLAHGRPESILGGQYSSVIVSTRAKKSTRYGFVFWVQGVWDAEAPAHILIKQFSEFQVILTPLANGQLNISVMVNADASVKKSAIRASAFSFAEASGFTISGIVDQCGAAQISSYQAGSSSRKDVFMIGDAAERFDPIGGMGMTHSLLSASLLPSQMTLPARDRSKDLLPLKECLSCYNCQWKLLVAERVTR